MSLVLLPLYVLKQADILEKESTIRELVQKMLNTFIQIAF